VRGRLALAAVAALTIAAGAAHAASTKPVVARDAKGDAHTTLDLTRFAIGRGADGRLRASLTLAGSWDGTDLKADSGPPGSLCVKLWTTSAPPDQTPDYLVCVTADKDDELRGSVLQERPNKLPARASSAVVSRPSGRTVTVRFSQSAVGRPAKLEAAAETTRPGCPRVSCIDLAPDAPKTLSLTLRTDGG
jgi:hypothetical protein